MVAAAPVTVPFVNGASLASCFPWGLRNGNEACCFESNEVLGCIVLAKKIPKSFQFGLNQGFFLIFQFDSKLDNKTICTTIHLKIPAGPAASKSEPAPLVVLPTVRKRSSPFGKNDPSHLLLYSSVFGFTFPCTARQIPKAARHSALCTKPYTPVPCMNWSDEYFCAIHNPATRCLSVL